MNIDFNIEWPTKKDSILNKGEKGQEALIEALTPSFFGYASSYKKAGDLIYKHREDYSSWEIDSLIYPIFFNYRQYIELMLKEIIKVGDDIFQTSNLEMNFHHNLNELWKTSKKSLIDTSFQEKENELKIVERIISEFNKLDPNSYSFRYPIDKKGNHNLEEIKSIDMTNLYELMEKMENFFEGCIIHIYNFRTYFDY